MATQKRHRAELFRWIKAAVYDDVNSSTQTHSNLHKPPISQEVTDSFNFYSTEIRNAPGAITGGINRNVSQTTTFFGCAVTYTPGCFCSGIPVLYIVLPIEPRLNGPRI